MIPLVSKRYFMNNLGLNDKAASTALMDGEASDLQNVQFDTRGAIVKRSGYAKRISAAISGEPAILGGIEFREKGGTTQVIIVCADNTLKILSDTETPASWTDRTNSMVVTNTATNYSCFTHTGDNDALVLTTQSDTPITINSALTASALTVPTSLTEAKYCIWWNNHLILANVKVTTSYPLRLYFYDAGSISAVTDTHYITIPSQDAKITGLATLFGNLYVFTPNEIHQISGTSYDDFVRVKTSSNVGTVSHWSIQNIENNLVFMSPKGIAVFDGIRSTNISDKIQTTLDGLAETRNIYSQSAHYKKRSQYWLSVSSSGSSTHDRVLVYDYLNKSWTVFKGINANCFINTRRSDNTERLYHGDYGGLVYLNDSTSNDNDVAIDGYWKSKAIDLETSMVKSFRHFTIFAEQEGSYNLNITYEIDFGGKGSSTAMTLSLAGNKSLWGTMVWGTDNWGGGTIVDARKNLVASVGRYLRIKFRTSASSTPFKIMGFELFAQPLGMR